MIYPENYSQYSSAVDTSSDGSHDFSFLSPLDRNIIVEVLRISRSIKYTSELQWLGVINEATQIRYKPRYVIHDIVIQACHDSTNVFDILAVGFAYKTKGALFRKQAIEYLERYQQLANRKEIGLAADCFLNAREPFFSYGLAELYSAEYQFETALEYATFAEKHNTFCAPGYPQLIAAILLKTNPADCVDYLESVLENPKYQTYAKLFSDELKKAKDKRDRGYIYRPRPYKAKPHEIEIEKQISAIAVEFLPNGKYFEEI